MEGVEAEGRTVNEATEKALEQLGLRRDQVNVEVLSEGYLAQLGERSFLALFCAGVFAAGSVGLVGALGIYINTYFWELTATKISVIVLGYCLSALLAVAITFPLVFGWLHFESVPGDLGRYRAYVFGFPTFSFAVDSWIAFLSLDSA